MAVQVRPSRRRLSPVLILLVAVATATPALAQSPPPSLPATQAAEASPAGSPGPAGAVVTSEDGALTVTLPVGVDPATITIDPGTEADLPADLDPATVVGSAYQLGPEGTTFEAPVIVTTRVPLDDPSGGVPVLVLVTTGADGALELLDDPRLTLDDGMLVVSGSTTHFSVFVTVELPRIGATTRLTLRAAPEVLEGDVGDAFDVAITASPARALTQPASDRSATGLPSPIVGVSPGVTFENTDTDEHLFANVTLTCLAAGHEVKVLLARFVAEGSRATVEVGLPVEVTCIDPAARVALKELEPIDIPGLEDKVAEITDFPRGELSSREARQFEGRYRQRDVVRQGPPPGEDDAEATAGDARFTVVAAAAVTEPYVVAMVTVLDFGVSKREFETGIRANQCPTKKVKRVLQDAFSIACKGFTSIAALQKGTQLQVGVITVGKPRKEALADARELLDYVLLYVKR